MPAQTFHPSARMLARLLAGYGVEQVVACPGTRNVPLIMAMSRQPGLTVTSVVDERSAAFVGLGMSLQSGRPVAVVCTSGSAILDMAPAIAECYYRGIPLIAVSADRPEWWVDQNDSQTIRQPGAIENIVKLSVDIAPDTHASADRLWQANRLINDALTTATAGLPGPVHINIQLDNPLDKEVDIDRESENAMVTRRICTMHPLPQLPYPSVKELATRLAGKRVLVLAGFAAPDPRVNKATARLSRLTNVAVMYEPYANLHNIPCGIGNPDTVLASLTPHQRLEMAPDIVITTGGSIVSAQIKNWLRDCPHTTHWALGLSRGTAVDTFRHLELRLEIEPGTFLLQLSSLLAANPGKDTGYAALFHRVKDDALKKAAEFIAQSPWCDLTVTNKLIAALPHAFNLQVSNGMAARYTSLCAYGHLHRIDCNRGVSGIDGSTSTAIGSSLLYPHPTALLTGDMSAIYDISALTSVPLVDGRFRMAVLDNDGGDIFRFIKTTRAVPECHARLAIGSHTRWDELAKAMNMEYLHAFDDASLDKSIKVFVNPHNRKPVLLHIDTSGSSNAEILQSYYKSIRQ